MATGHLSRMNSVPDVLQSFRLALNLLERIAERLTHCGVSNGSDSSDLQDGATLPTPHLSPYILAF